MQFIVGMKNWKRMCESVEDEDCEKCDLNKLGICWENPNRYNIENFEKFETIVSEWAARNPVKSNIDKLRELFPDAQYEKLGMCPEALLGKDISNCRRDCKDCKKEFWESEYIR